MLSIKCPVCQADAKSTLQKSRPVQTVECPFCQNFESPRTTEITLLDSLTAHDRRVLQHWLRHASRNEGPIVLTDEIVKSTLDNYVMPLPDEWQDYLIKAIGEAHKQNSDREYIVLDLKQCMAEVGAPNESAVYQTVLGLISQGILEGQPNIHRVQIKLTVPFGWRTYRRLINNQATAPAQSRETQATNIVINAENVSGVFGGTVSGQTTVVSHQNMPASTPAVAASTGVKDRWVNSSYPEKLGLLKKLDEERYDVKWESANDETSSIHIDGWEYVLLNESDGTSVRLKVRDHPVIGGYVVLLKRKKKDI